jgi:hypothetical protein
VGGYLIYGNQMDALKLLYHGQQQIVQQMQALELTLRHVIAVHDYNSGREPSDRLPLELTPPAPGPGPHPSQEAR